MEPQTKQFRKRSAILNCLRASHAHPSADMVYTALQAEHPDISLATVYRNLALFKQQGLIMSLGTVGGVERFDGNTRPHVHFVCNVCHAVIDLPQITPPQSLEANVAQVTGGTVTGCQLTFQGCCGQCQSLEAI